MDKLNFCIMQDPINSNGAPIVFFTKLGKDFLDTSIIESPIYEQAILTMKDLGYVESDLLTFEFSRDPDYKVEKKQFLIKILENEGFVHNQILEINLLKDFALAKNYILDKNLPLNKLIETNLHLKSPMEPMDYFKKASTLYKIPEIGEKITLYFYLFLECKFKNDHCYLNLNGDFFSLEDDKLKNLLQVAKCDFIRTKNTYNPNVVTLKSVLTNGDIIKTLPMHIGGSFFKKTQKTEKVFVYHLMEVKNNIPLKNRIRIEVENIHNFDNMMLISSEIKKRYMTQLRSKVRMESVEELLKDCDVILNKKMLKFAKEEQYENASVVKKDIAYIKSRITKINNSEEYLPMKLFVKKFAIN